MNQRLPASTDAAPADASVAGEEDPGAALDTLAKPASAAARGGRSDGPVPTGPDARPGPADKAPTPGDRDSAAPGSLSEDAPP